MKINRLFSIAAATMMMVACSSEETALNNNPAAGPQMQFTATIAAPNSGATTRTEYTEVTTGEAAGTINVVWKAGDEIALIHNGVKDVATVKTVNADGSATITGDITKANNGEDVEVCYPAAAWEWAEKSELVEKSGAIRNATFLTNITTKQDGTLKYIQDNLDTRMGKGTLKVDGDKATLSDNVKLASQIAIWKLTMQDDATPTPAPLKATQVSVKLGAEEPWTVAGTTTLGTATSTVYLAMDKLEKQYLTIEATVGSDTYKYENEDISLALGQYYQSTVTMAPAATDLSKLTGDYTAQDGETLTGTLAGNYKITIADGASVTLGGISIDNSSSGTAPCIICEGDATITLADGSNNTITAPGTYAAIQAGGAGKKLIIKAETAGTGKLTATAGYHGAAIGSNRQESCGDIEIQGGDITANGGSLAAAIGSGNAETSDAACGTITISGGKVTANGGVNGGAGIGTGAAYEHSQTCGGINITGGTIIATGGEGTNGRGAGIGTGVAKFASSNASQDCGNINISGGTVEATGGKNAAGIGTGYAWHEGTYSGRSCSQTCGTITIGTGVTSVKATKGDGSPNSIGVGNKMANDSYHTHTQTCGTITIGGDATTYATGVTISPFTYPAPTVGGVNDLPSFSGGGDLFN